MPVPNIWPNGESGRSTFDIYFVFEQKLKEFYDQF